MLPGLTFILLCLLLLPFTSAKGNAVDLWIAELDSETTGISVDDPSAVTKLRSLIEQTKTEGSFSQQLYLPVRQLGILLQSQGYQDEAITAFRQLQNIVHRHYGVYSPLQLEPLSFIINSHIQKGDIDAADSQHQFSYRVSMKSFSPNQLEYTDAKIRLADWYRFTARFDKALKLYKESALNLNKDDLRAISRVKRSIALTSYLSGRCCLEDELAAAYNIGVKAPDFDRADLERALIDYVDASYLAGSEVNLEKFSHELSKNLEPALLGFQNPKALFSTLAKSRGFKDSNAQIILFKDTETGFSFGKNRSKPDPVSVGNPVTMCGETYRSLVKNKDQKLSIDVTVDINPQGKPILISLAGDAPPKLNRYIRTSLHNSRFRPAIDQFGKPSKSTISFRQTFSANNLSITSSANVYDWSNQMVAQSCQLTELASL